MQPDLGLLHAYGKKLKSWCMCCDSNYTVSSSTGVLYTKELTHSNVNIHSAQKFDQGAGIQEQALLSLDPCKEIVATANL